MSKAKPIKRFHCSDNKEWGSYKYLFNEPDTNYLVCCDSLINLKKYVRRDTNYRLIIIKCKNECLSYGIDIIDEYPYQPRR